MATMTIKKGVRGTSYKVEQMTNGKRHSKTFKCADLANNYKAQIEADALDTFFIGSIKMDKAIAQYLSDYVAKDPNIFTRLEFWRVEIGSLTANDVTKRVLVKALNKLSADKSNSTINRYKTSLSSVFSYLIDADLVSSNPCCLIKSRKEPLGVERYLSDDEYTSLMKAANDSKWDKLPLLLLLASTSGARRGELISLTWNDVNFKDKVIALTDTKNGTSRLLPLTQAVIAELMRFRKIGDGYIFTMTKSKRAFINFDHHFKVALKAAGITNFRFHDLRHTCASTLSRCGINIQVIANILGHANIQTTMRYIHLATTTKAEVINKVFADFNVTNKSA